MRLINWNTKSQAHYCEWLVFLAFWIFMVRIVWICDISGSYVDECLRSRACLHQASASMWRQCCNEACDTVLIDHNRVAPKCVATPFWSDSICFHCGQWELCCKRHCSIDATLTLTWCKGTLKLIRRTNYVRDILEGTSQGQQESCKIMSFVAEISSPNRFLSFLLTNQWYQKRNLILGNSVSVES